MTTTSNSGSWLPIRRAGFRDLIEAFPPALKVGARSIWLEILMRARQHPGRVEGRQLARGQLVFGEEKMGAVCGLSRQQVRTLLLWSKKLEKLTIKTTKHGSIATVIDFDSYVPPDIGTNQQNGQQVTNGQPTANHIQQVTSNKRTRTASPPAHPRDEFMDGMMQIWQDCWPEFEAPRHSLLAKWRKEYGADEVLAMTKKVGLGGKEFPTGEDLTRYLNGALSKEAERRSHTDAEPFTIADSLGKPINDPDERLARIMAFEYGADPDQGQWFTIPDTVVRTGEMDEDTRRAILGRLPPEGVRSEEEARL